MQAHALQLRLEDIVGNLGCYSRAVPGFSIGIHGSPVRHARQRAQGKREDMLPRPSPEVGDKADTTGIVLKSRIVQSFDSIPFADRHVLRHPSLKVEYLYP